MRQTLAAAPGHKGCAPESDPITGEGSVAHVLELGGHLNEILPGLAELPEMADLLTGDRDARKPAKFEEPCERDGVVAVCLLLGLRNDSELVGVYNHYPVHPGADALIKVVDVLGCFYSQMITGAETMAEGRQSRFGESVGLELGDVLLTQKTGDETGLVEINPDASHA